MKFSFLISVFLLALALKPAGAAISEEERNQLAETINLVCRETVDKIPRDEIPKRAHAWLAGGRLKTIAVGNPEFEKYKAIFNADLKSRSEAGTMEDSPVIFLKKDEYLASILFYKAKGLPNSWFFSRIQVNSLKTGEYVLMMFPFCGGAGSEKVRAPEGLVP